MELTTFVGLDVHKRATSVAIAESGAASPGRAPAKPTPAAELLPRKQAIDRGAARAGYAARGRSMTS
jgi:hypothetical protein